MNSIFFLMRDLSLLMSAQRRFEFEKPVIQNIILDATAKALGLDPAMIIGKRRLTDLSQARQIIAYLLAKHSPLSYRVIGELLGGRDHSTAIIASRKAQDYIDTKYKPFLDKLKRVTDELEEVICL